MQNELTYVGPDSMGPHYTDSGKLPAFTHQTLFPDVIVQTPKGVQACYFAPDPESTSRQCVFLNHSMRKIEGAICWWHLPAAAPITEREWWMAQAWNYRNYTDLFGFSFYGYDPKTSELWYKSENVADVVNFKMAKKAAYDHWVAAGRP